ncbi:hypothetical protein [uncultured Mitsuokella sp.]|uniref:hypothetical protein n=1 Tax=uncultured Mitsuokella sp. TaxID=453120 RepID=UPI00266FBE25|nr:hypothetical protein [uncultured Mitsuokella sp.]
MSSLRRMHALIAAREFLKEAFGYPDDVVLVAVEELSFPFPVTIRLGKECVPAVPVICSRINVDSFCAIDDGAGKKRGQVWRFPVKEQQPL